MSKLLIFAVLVVCSGCSEPPCNNPPESQRDLKCEADMKARGMTILGCGGCWKGANK